MYADMNNAYEALTGEEAPGPVIDLQAQVDGGSGGVVVRATIENETDGFSEIWGKFKDRRRIDG